MSFWIIYLNILCITSAKPIPTNVDRWDVWACAKAVLLFKVRFTSGLVVLFWINSQPGQEMYIVEAKIRRCLQS